MDTGQNAGSNDTDTSTSSSATGAADDAGTILSTGDSNQGEGAGEGQQDENLDSTGGKGESGEEGSKQADGEEGKKEGGDGDGVPETYDFTMPEGMTLDETTASAASEVFKKHGFSQEVASELTQIVAEQRQRESEAAQEAFAKQLDDWKTELKNDPDFGGDDFEKNSAKAFGFIEATVPDGIKDEVMSFFVTTGAGNHPGLVKYVHHLAGLMPVGEDQPGSSQGSGSDTSKSRAERMYPND